MKILSCLSVCTIACGVSACSIHPLPEDFSGDSTQDIVNSIRCEIRGALLAELIHVLKNPKFDDYTREVGEHLEENPEAILFLTWDGLQPPKSSQLDDQERAIAARIPRNLGGRKLHKDAIALIESRLQTSIAYEFRFKITENNNGTANANFRLPFSNGTFTLGLSAGNNRARLAERKVSMEDSFKSYQKLDCPGGVKQPNWIYPITGQVGMDEAVNTYLRIITDAELVGEGSKLKSMTDTLTYTSTFLATATPNVSLNPGGLDEFRLASADGNFRADRTDVHEVVFTIKPPAPAVPKKKKRIPLGDGVVLEVKVPIRVVQRGAQTFTTAPQRASRRQRSFFIIDDADRANMEGARQELDRQLLIDRNRQLLDIIDE